jgi:hypothetical protein
MKKEIPPGARHGLHQNHQNPESCRVHCTLNRNTPARSSAHHSLSNWETGDLGGGTSLIIDPGVKDYCVKITWALLTFTFGNLPDLNLLADALRAPAAMLSWPQTRSAFFGDSLCLIFRVTWTFSHSKVAATMGRFLGWG